MGIFLLDQLSEYSTSSRTADTVMGRLDFVTMMAFVLQPVATIASSALLSGPSLVQPLTLISNADLTVKANVLVNSQLNSTTNLTFPPDVPVNNIPLDQKSLLAASILTMAELAKHDFYGNIPNFEISAPGYSVTIKLTVSTPSQQIGTPLAVWALYQGVGQMAVYNKYQQATITTYWDNVQVALIRILPTQSSRSTLEQQRNSSDLLSLLPSNANIAAVGNAGYPQGANTTNFISYGASEAWDCRFHPSAAEAETLSTSEVIGPVMAALKNVAPTSRDDRMDEPFQSEMQGVDTRLTFFGPTNDPMNPTYQYKYVISSSQMIAFWLLTQERLAEMSCGMYVNTHLVGVLILEKKNRPDDE